MSRVSVSVPTGTPEPVTEPEPKSRTTKKEHSDG